MSGQKLVDTLRALNFPNVEGLDPQSLDWPFENEALSPFLEWFCNNISEANLLQKQEMDDYRSLCQSGEVILKGRELDEALSNFDFAQDDSVSEENLQQEIDHLTSNLQYYKKQKNRLSKRRTLLNNHHLSLSHRLTKLAGVESNVKQQYKETLTKMYADNTQMNESLEQLTTAVSDMSHLYDASSGDGPAGPGRESPSSSPAMFLSQVPVQQYYNTEEAYTTQLTSYTKKQFFQGIAEMASCGEDSRFEILEVSDPDSLLVRGESEEVNIRDCKELARLQKLYVKSETDRLKALCEMRRMKGRLESCKSILESLKTGTFCTETAKIRERLQKLQTSVQVLRRDFQTMSDEEVPKLIKECKDAKVLRVLTGDYNLKLARQDYFTNNQDKVINQLVQQRARNEFLTMALEVELRRHRRLHHILTSVFSQLNQQHSQWQQRQTVMGDGFLTPARHKRETVDSRDKSTARLYHMLNEGEMEGDRQLFLTYSSLLENARSLQQKHSSMTSALATSSNTDHHNVQLLERTVQQCERSVYQWSSTTSGQPLLTPRPIHEIIMQLKDMMKPLEQGIMEVLKDVDSKKKILKSDTLLARERKLFTYFFTNQGKLHQYLEELSGRIKAEKSQGLS